MKSEQYRWKCNLCLSTGILMSGMLVPSGLGEHVLAYATQGADKILRQVFPPGARGDAVVRVAGGLIVNPTANGASVNLHKFSPFRPTGLYFLYRNIDTHFLRV